MPKTVHSHQGDPADLTIWRERGRVSEPGLVEKVLDTNRGLAAKGQILPTSTPMVLPDPPGGPPPPRRVKLWD